MNNASLELGGDNWAAKDTKLLASTVSDDSGRFYPREFTFTRGSNLSATRVNADGYIEKGYENLLVQSNQFDTTWTTSDSSVTGGQSGYDGSNNAWKLQSSNSSTSYIQQSVSASGVQTMSVYAKSGTTNFFAFYKSSSVNAFFNLSNGSVGTTTGIVDTNVEDVGDGWYRCSMTFSASTSSIKMYLSDANGSFSSAVGSNILIQSAQLESGLAATEPIESGASAAKAGILENEPRIDYSSGTASLLSEPQRTNLITQSEYIAGLSIASSATLSLESEANPSGGGFAYKVTATEVSSRVQESIGTQGSNFVFSGFFKGSGAATRIRFRNNQGEGVFYNIDANGAFTLYSENAVNDNYGIEDYGNGWHRIFFETTTSNSSVNYAQVYCDVLDGDGSVLAWGLQAEQGSYPTSYIPTYGTSQTRGADRPQILNTTTGVLSQTAFTLFFEADLTLDTINNFRDIVAFRGASKELRFETRTDNSVRVQSNMTTSGDNFNSATIGNTDNKKFAMTFTTSQVRLYADGSLVNTYNGAYSSDLVHILFMNSTSLGVETKTNFKQYLLFTSDLSNDECITLTTI